MSICLSEKYAEREMHRRGYEYFHLHINRKDCCARLSRIFTYRTYNYLCVKVTYKHLLGVSVTLRGMYDIDFY